MSLQTETIEVTGLPVGTTDALEQIGRERGKSAEELVRDMIQVEIQAASSFDEILAPIRQGFKESGLSEEEIDELFKESREEVYREKQTGFDHRFGHQTEKCETEK